MDEKALKKLKKAEEKERKALEKEIKKLGQSGNSMDLLIDLRMGPLSDSYFKAVDELKNNFQDIENVPSNFDGEELKNFKAAASKMRQF